jgi:hypothetical protein
MKAAAKSKSSKEQARNRSIAAYEANISRHEVAAINAATPEERDAMMARVEKTRKKLEAFKRAR